MGDNMSILSVRGRGSFDFEVGKNLLSILKENGIMIENPCAGKGYCGKCKVQILEGLYDDNLQEHRKFLSEEEIKKGIRLSCLYVPKNDISIELIDNEEKVKILDKGYLPDFKIDPLVKKECKKLSYDSLATSSDIEAILKSEKRALPIDIIRKLSDLEEGDIYTLVKYDKEIICIEDGDTTGSLYGFAVDIGTTTIVASLIDLNTGVELDNASSINPQKNYGLDVLSRINYACKEENGTYELSKSVIDCLNGLFEELCINNNISTENIYDITIAANTTMLHLLLGVNPKSLGVNPYRPIFKEGRTYLSEDLGLKISNKTRVYCLPSVSAFIGADITAGAIVSKLNTTKERVLFIDIGTNGEMILSDNGKMIACSCAAGPALEGMNITCGVRAGVGAIEGITIGNDSVSIEVIGDKYPNGICGSGILEAISELNRRNLVNKSGRIKKKEDLEDDFLKSILIEEGKKRSVVLVDDIIITQNDIRQVQLAKGAILSGIISLSNHLNLTAKDIDKVIIAGQFGAHLKVESLVGIGMLPKEFEDKVNYIGNSSKSGAVLCLLDKSKREEVKDVLDNCGYLELSLLDNYEGLFAKCLSFDINKLL